jgi:hypothetical protein
VFCGSVACLLASPSMSPAVFWSAVLLSPGSIPCVHALLLVARFLNSVGVGSFPLFTLFCLGLVLIYAPHLLRFIRIIDVDRLAEERACSLSLCLLKAVICSVCFFGCGDLSSAFFVLAS